jgi:cysteine synthase A
LRAFGAQVVLTEPKLALPGCIERAQELAKLIPNAYILQQVWKKKIKIC